MRLPIARCTGSLFVALALLGCAADADTPIAVLDPLAAATESRAAEDCMNVAAEATFPLGLWMFNDQLVFGALPTPITLGGIEGTMASFLTAPIRTSGRHGQGAQHFLLSHVFWADDDLGMFLTEDKAVCAPAGGGPLTCRVNDHLEIVSGTGIFAGAHGFLHNHGVIEFTGSVTGILHASIRGRVCGGGVGE